MLAFLFSLLFAFGTAFAPAPTPTPVVKDSASLARLWAWTWCETMYYGNIRPVEDDEKWVEGGAEG